MARQSPVEVVVRRHIGVLRRSLPQAARGDVESLHQARVATRRLREVLPLFAEQHRRARQLRHTVRRLTKALGPIRALDVALENLQALERDPGASRAALTFFEQVLADERRSQQRGMRAAVGKIRVKGFRTRVLRLARQASERPDRQSTRQAGAAWQRAGLRSGQLRSTLARAGVRFQPDRLHEVRIAVKKLRYALESATALSGARSLQGTHRVEQAQELLGRIHDLQELIARLRHVRPSSRGATREILSDLRRLARRLDSECRGLHARYLETRPGLVTVCDRVERAAHRRSGV